MPRIEAVFFDVGETIVDESREYGTCADWLGVPTGWVCRDIHSRRCSARCSAR
ncbi:MAG: hypothetical protein ACRDSR_22130 [Pseudonocardiaceae bacterium]